MFAACASNAVDERAPASDSAASGDAGAVTIEQTLAEHTEAWMEIDGVEGTGIGLCNEAPCIKIFVSRPPESFEGRLPETVEGHPVRLEPTGRFEPR